MENINIEKEDDYFYTTTSVYSGDEYSLENCHKRH
jgi:hypothetical protein